MAKNPPDGCQRIAPYLMYEDAATALDFLVQAFGFEERFRIPMPDGAVGHAEIGYQDNLVMLASTSATTGCASPKDLPARHGFVLCYVDDVDAHFAHAKAAGATILAELEDKPYRDRMYGASDPEGHHWYFATHVKDVDPSELHGG